MKTDVKLVVRAFDIKRISSLFIQSFSSDPKIKVEVFSNIESTGMGVVFVSASGEAVSKILKNIILDCPKSLFSQKWRTKMGVQCVFSVFVLNDGKSFELELTCEELALITSIGGSIDIALTSMKEFKRFRSALSD